MATKHRAEIITKIKDSSLCILPQGFEIHSVTVQKNYTINMQEKYLLQMLLQVPSLPGEVWGPAEVGGEDCRIVCAGGEVRQSCHAIPAIPAKK